MPPAVWDSDRQLRHDALWKDADQILTTRAMMRCALALGWIVLAALTIPGDAWAGGIPMLLASGISLLHASHTLVVRIEEHLPHWLRRLFKRLFVYPDQPHLNWVGVAELAGLVSLGMVTGWPGRLLAADPATAAVGSVITIGILGSVVANTTAHAIWEVAPGPLWMRRVRLFIGPFGAAAGFALLWSASPATPARFVAVAGPALVMAGSWRLIAQVAGQVRGFDEARAQTTESAHRIDSRLVHSTLKNPTRAIIDELARIPDPALREGVRRLCYGIGGFAQGLALGRTRDIRSAGEVLQALLSFNPDWAVRYGASVTHDLEPDDLTHRDAGIIFMAVSDLVTNAAMRSATQLEVALTCTPTADGSILTLRVLCLCGARIGPITPASSLMGLARLVHGENGTMTIDDAGDGSHVFELAWPSGRRPRAQTATRETIDA
ncbi:MAG TPA: hypothetical protein VN969_05835 [Streptosporangiaceae bacterium]|nr:hypothetical protein [Streptosporangiaceae bacterium]